MVISTLSCVSVLCAFSLGVWDKHLFTSFRALKTDQRNDYTQVQLGAPMSLLGLRKGARVTQRQRSHRKADPSMGDNSQKLHPQSSLWGLIGRSNRVSFLQRFLKTALIILSPGIVKPVNFRSFLSLVSFVYFPCLACSAYFLSFTNLFPASTRDSIQRKQLHNSQDKSCTDALFHSSLTSLHCLLLIHFPVLTQSMCTQTQITLYDSDS